MKFSYFYFLLVTFPILSSCFFTVKPHKNISKSYDFSKPKVLKLTTALSEISGLAFYNNAIYTHNDEQGILFTVNTESGKITEKVTFGENGDYEGIEIVKNTVYIIKNNGDISSFELNKENPTPTTLSNKLNKHNNIEGLSYHKKTNDLLIAFKGNTLDDSKHKKAIYNFDLTNKALDKTPFLEIKLKKIEKYIKKEFNNSSKKELDRFIKRGKSLSPSGIAIHPKTKDIYIVSARGSLLVVYNNKKELKELIFLNITQLPQPEGICFDDKKNLYISTETKGTVGRIYKYAH